MKNNQYTHREQFLRVLIEELNTDILFECFAGLLCRSKSIESNQIHVIPSENHRRSYSNDISLAPSTEFDELDHRGLPKESKYLEEIENGVLTIYTSRTAILDYLPEAFYTQVGNADEISSDDDKLSPEQKTQNQRDKLKAELKSANRFFKPLEIEYNKVRIQKELEELNNLENLDKMFDTFWGVFNISNDRWKRFVRTIHLIPYIIGDKNKTKALITYVLGTPVSLTFDIEESCTMNKQLRSSLTGTDLVLGYNISLGNTVYDYLETCTLKIEELSDEQFYEYFDENSKDRKLLNEILKYYFPLNLELKLDYSIKQNEEIIASSEQFETDEHKLFPIPVVGFSSILSA